MYVCSLVNKIVKCNETETNKGKGSRVATKHMSYKKNIKLVT